MRKNKTVAICIVVIVNVLIVCIGYKLSSEKTKNQLDEQAVEVENSERVELAEKNERPTVIISNANAKRGNTVTLSVSIVNNPGILGMSLSLSYDENIMQLTKVENGQAFNNVLDMNHSKEFGNGCVFLWDGEDISQDQIADGEILKLEFKILDSARVGKTPVVLLDDEEGTVDRDLNTVDLDINSGYITVIE